MRLRPMLRWGHDLWHTWPFRWEIVMFFQCKIMISDARSWWPLQSCQMLPCSGKKEEWFADRSPRIVSNVMLSAWWMVGIVMNMIACSLLSIFDDTDHIRMTMTIMMSWCMATMLMKSNLIHGRLSLSTRWRECWLDWLSRVTRRSSL